MEYYHNGCRSWDWCALPALFPRVFLLLLTTTGVGPGTGAPPSVAPPAAGHIGLAGCMAIATAADSGVFIPQLRLASSRHLGRRRCSASARLPCSLSSPRLPPPRYFPDFYAPLATDLVDLHTYDIQLRTGSPFPPLAQLLSVLPPQSGQLLPLAYAELMQSTTSPIYDAFPVDFTLDLNGKVRETV